MKIIQISYTGFGGLNSVVFGLIECNPIKNVDWSIAYIGDQRLSIQNIERSKKNKIKYNAFSHDEYGRLFSWFKLFNYMVDVKPDIIVCHSLSSIIICYSVAKYLKIPLIVVEHTANNIKNIKDWFFSFLNIILSVKIIYLTDQYRLQIIKKFKYLNYFINYKIIPNGVDTNRFIPIDYNLNLKNEIIVGMASRFSKTKRQDLLVQTIDYIHKIRPNLKIILRFAGDGEEHERVLDIANSSSLNDRIKFDGLINEEDIINWYQKLDFYVHATDGETFSTSILQAMSTGKPIIASAVPGVIDFFEINNNIGLLSNNTVLDFSNKIIYLIDNPNLTAQISKNCRLICLEKYDIYRINEQYMDLINNYLK